MSRMFLLMAMLLLPMQSRAQPVNDAVVVAGGTGAVLDEYLSRFSAFGYSFSVLVAEGDRVVLRKAYGPGINTASVFNVASVSKQFTAAAIMKLVDQDRLSLSDPLAKFFPDVPDTLKAITIDQLLAHTSGLIDDYGLYQRDPGLDRDQFRRRIFARTPATPPGRTWEYSNDGYSLLAMIVERAAREPFTNFLKRELFARAGLTSTGFTGDAWPAKLRPTPSGGAQPPEPEENRWVGSLGASDVITTPSDLFRWERALRDGRVLSAASVATLFTKVINVFPSAGLSYARGWWSRTVEFNGSPQLNLFHSGRQETGVSAWYSRFPGRQLVLIFASHQAWENGSMREALFSATRPSVLERIIFGGDVSMPPQPRDRPDLQQFAGRYRLDAANWIEVRGEPPFLSLIPHGQKVYDALLPPGSGDAATVAMEEATTRTQRIFEQLLRGRSDLFRSAVGTRDDGSSMDPPRFSAFEVLGSYPVGRITERSRNVVTHVLATSLEGRTEHVHLLWNETKLSWSFASYGPFVPLFRPTSETGFSNFHPFIQLPSHLNFEGGQMTMTTAPAGRISLSRE